MAAPQGPGNPGAESNLGKSYYTGRGVPQDYVKAAFYFNQAGSQGDESAQYMLATMYASGKGVPKSAVNAAYWYEKAAEQGNALAQDDLGGRCKGEFLVQESRGPGQC